MTDQTGARRAPEPWWARLIPDLKAWAAVGLFLLSWRIIELIAGDKSLTNNQGFMFLAQAIIVSGLISGVVASLYTALKTVAEKSAAKAPDKEPGQ